MLQCQVPGATGKGAGGMFLVSRVEGGHSQRTVMLPHEISAGKCPDMVLSP